MSASSGNNAQPSDTAEIASAVLMSCCETCGLNIGTQLCSSCGAKVRCVPCDAKWHSHRDRRDHKRFPTSLENSSTMSTVRPRPSGVSADADSPTVKPPKAPKPAMSDVSTYLSCAGFCVEFYKINIFPYIYSCESISHLAEARRKMVELKYVLRCSLSNFLIGYRI